MRSCHRQDAYRAKCSRTKHRQVEDLRHSLQLRRCRVERPLPATHAQVCEIQVTVQSRVAQGVRSMSLAEGARLVGMSVLPAELSPPEGACSSLSDEESQEDEPEESSSSTDGQPADAPVPCLLLVTQHVRSAVRCQSSRRFLVSGTRECHYAQRTHASEASRCSQKLLMPS
jgi:DNA gyrase/topoisomerase IV subunit A